MRLLLGFMWLLHWLPLPVLGRLGNGLGSLLFRIMAPRRHITLTNLRLCMPQLSEQERKQLAIQHFQAYARSVLERSILWWAPLERLKKLIVLDPALPVAEIQSGPTILLCPHFVSLDVAGAAVAMEISMSSIYTQQRNEVFDKALRDGRTRFRPQKLLAREAGVKPIIRELRNGGGFFMLPDMDFGAKDAEFVPFFGIPAATLTATARIASVTNAQVIPVIATMLPNFKGWKVTFHPAWKNYPGDDMVAATRFMNEFIEKEVLKAPAEYFWTHKRFKTRPPGEPGVY
ncbi:LpxL/LpxP family acyltransferase [Undibacterium terreum]|uniref:Lipid A biosynthesis lauroyl acyltransferase n=1 Tax=Undibacterium terreum TaxID=1224302 RepID=A0A916XLF1_9BURK|nr:lipid A biosynthesis acyltransferase [Undibacterium terreum]GGC80971.1 lipid A biosynthesis lauroyl acyltransferase [Undibacterium terreum]